MNRIVLVAGAAAVLLLLWSCSDNQPGPISPQLLSKVEQDLDPSLHDALAVVDSEGNDNFNAHLKGRNETPPNDSHGQGEALFHINVTHDTISYKLIVANISNVFASHIHVGPAGVAGPVVQPLYSAPPGGGRIQGPIAEGWFTARDLVGPFAGSTNLDLFIEKLHHDSLYVNVHTNDGIPSSPPGIGNLPAGEIRGQLKSHF